MSEALLVHADPDGDSWGVLDKVVRAANGLQTTFRVSLVPLPAGILPSGSRVDFDDLEDRLSRARPKVAGLVFVEAAPKESRLVDERLPHRILVTCAVNRGVDAPPFRLYVLYQIAAAALTLGAGLDPEANHDMVHDPPVGCLWDWWKGDQDRHLVMLTARLCRACRDRLTTHGVLTDEHFAAAQQILEYIRRSMMGDSPEIANRVFVAHGHGSDWETLRDLLTSWKLPVEHFNSTPGAGTMTADRWRDMLNRSRFAFAVMSKDDDLGGGKWRARQNVVHEIGLCHARLGLHNTAILLQEGTESFSNIDGVTRIQFEGGKLGEKAGEIRNLLESRGLL